MRMPAMTWRVPRVICLCGLVVMCATPTARADKTHAQTSRANRLYDQERYGEALQLYDQTLLEAPQEHKLDANRGSALYKLDRLDEADTAYQRALQIEDRSALADIHYNRGNALYREGEAMVQSGGQNAMEKFKAAVGEYAQALDLRCNDKDAKWNLQLAYNRIERMKQQQSQQNQQQDKDKRQDQKQDQQQKQNQQNKQDKQQQDRQDQKDQQKQDQNAEQKQQPQPQPQNKEEEMKKAEAARLIRQFADDDKNLNKPEKMAPAGEARLEKDW
jgi:Ca-activated chloride channel family protein